MWSLIPVERWIPLAIVALVACERIGELFISERHRRRLLAQGGVEVGRAHYPAMVAIHTAWIIAVIAWIATSPPRIVPGLAGLYALTQALRAWVMISLGPYWTTRIITVPKAPLVIKGPYRFLRHPNYVVVTAEIALLPLALGAVWTAVVFSILNAAILRVRIRAENAALAPRRSV